MGSIMERDWNESYITGETPWDHGAPEPLLVKCRGRLPAEGHILELGCGTGANARYLAESGLSVVAVDLSPVAIDQARQQNSHPSVEYHTLDLLEQPLPGSDYDAVFDRGCFHVFGDPDQQRRFVESVAGALRPGGCWLSVIGSTEGPPRDHGPPRRTAADIIGVVEPLLEVLSFEADRFVDSEGQPQAWLALFRRREQPAQPPTPG